MKRNGQWISIVLVLACLVALGGCSAVPKGASRQVTVNQVTVRAEGAGIVKVDGGKVTYQAKCTDCGFVGDPVTIETPAEGKPFQTEWICPKCGHRQTITVVVLAAGAGG